MNVTKLTEEQYVSVVESGGKAFSFHPDYCKAIGKSEEDTAYKCLVNDGDYDDWPDLCETYVYYTLTE